MAYITYKLHLTDKEVQMLISALATVMPHGGGSDEMVLCNRIVDQTSIGEDTDITTRYCNTVVDAWKECQS